MRGMRVHIGETSKLLWSLSSVVITLGWKKLFKASILNMSCQRHAYITNGKCELEWTKGCVIRSHNNIFCNVFLQCQKSIIVKCLFSKKKNWFFQKIIKGHHLMHLKVQCWWKNIRIPQRSCCKGLCCFAWFWCF